MGFLYVLDEADKCIQNFAGEDVLAQRESAKLMKAKLSETRFCFRRWQEKLKRCRFVDAVTNSGQPQRTNSELGHCTTLRVAAQVTVKDG